MLKVLKLFVIVFFLNQNSVKADFVKPNSKIKPDEVIKIQLKSLMKNRSEVNNVSIKSIENEYKKNIPAERFALPNEVASAVCFLCSNEASYINGINLPIDGGYSVSL